MNKNDLCFIRPKGKKDYWHFAIAKLGYDIIIPYYDINIIFRLLRELWFKLKLPYESIWFNKTIISNRAKIYIIKDPLITVNFIKWIKKIKPNSRIILDFDNRVGMSINPNDIKDYSIELWSYDFDDCHKYAMNQKPIGYFDIYKVEKFQEPIYDILFVGRDKNRLKELIKLKTLFQNMELKTKFHITPNRSYMICKNVHYKHAISYRKYMDLISKSRAILNIMPVHQKSITQRELEAVFNNKKCITNNKSIISFELYHPNRYFIIGVDDFSNLISFLKAPYPHVSTEKLSKYSIDKVIDFMVNKTLELKS